MSQSNHGKAQRARQIEEERRALIESGASSLAVCAWGRTRRVYLASLRWPDYPREASADAAAMGAERALSTRKSVGLPTCPSAASQADRGKQALMAM